MTKHYVIKRDAPRRFLVNYHQSLNPEQLEVVTAGAGLRIVVPAMGPVPIAFDFGFPVVKGPGDQQQVFSFWVGLFR